MAPRSHCLSCSRLRPSASCWPFSCYPTYTTQMGITWEVTTTVAIATFPVPRLPRIVPNTTSVGWLPRARGPLGWPRYSGVARRETMMTRKCHIRRISILTRNRAVAVGVANFSNWARWVAVPSLLRSCLTGVAIETTIQNRAGIVAPTREVTV